jgi:dienelactone hydrolase
MAGFTNRVLACAVASALALAGCSSSATRTNAPATPSPTSVPSTTTTTVRPRTYGVGTREATYVDTSRPTNKNNAYPGASSRTIRVRFYYPALGGAPAIAGGPFPVVLFSHGHNGLPEGYAALLGDLARAGYVVVAPAYPLSNSAAPGGATVADLGNQPKDASFVLDRVLADASTTKTWPRNFLDAGRIGVAGHSLGGLTTYGLVYNACCVDRRIKAAVVLAGAGLGAGSPGEYSNIRTPLLAIHGDQDRTIPIPTGRDSFQHANRPKFFLTILGGSHSGEARGGTTPGQRVLTRSMIAFFDYYLRGVGTLGTLRKAATKPGLTTFDAKP